MSVRGRRLLWLLIGVGTVIKVVVAFKTYGVMFDIDSFRITAQRFDDLHFNLYSSVTSVPPGSHVALNRWPYPPGYLPWIGASVRLAVWTGLPFHGLIQLPPIAADGVLAWLVQHLLGRRGASQGLRLAAAGLIALGPSFVAVSGYHGQIDSLAILPAVGALAVWERDRDLGRARWAGLLLGIACVIKTVPVLMVLALLPTAVSRKEGARLLLWTALIPALALAPFFVTDPSGVLNLLRYRGVPGVGGLSLVVQPDLSNLWLKQSPVHLSVVSRLLFDSGGAIILAALACYASFVARFRPAPVEAAVLLWLTVYVFAPNFFLQYLLWGLPFFLIAAHVRAVFWLQAYMVVPMVIAYLSRPPGHPFTSDAPVVVYTVVMVALWVGWVVVLFLQGRAMVRARRPVSGRDRGASR